MNPPPLQPTLQPNQTHRLRQRRWVALAAAFWASQAVGAEVLDRVVAVIEGQVLTQSELELEARVALVQRGGVAAAAAPLDEGVLKAALELSIAHRLQVREAERLQAFALEEGELERAVADFRGKFASEAELARFLARQEADLQGLTAVLARRVRAEKILDSKIRLKAQVSEAEVKRYYDDHPQDFAADYELARPTIRELLVREKYARLARAELAQLRRTADVRLVAPFARGGEG